MSEESPTGTANPNPADVPAAASPTGTVNPEKPQSDSDGDLGEGGKKALEAERKRAAKAERDLKAMQARLDEIEAAKLSDLERAQKQATEAAAEAEKARAEVLRFRIAAKHGITDEDAELFLTGSDEDTLTRQAERLSARAAEADKPRSPKPDPNQGRINTGSLDPRSADLAQIEADLAATRR